MKESIKVLNDYRNLKHFMTIKQLNQHQARWTKFLLKFNFRIIYRSDTQDIKLDNLTRRIQNLSASNDDARRQFQQQIILKKSHLKSDMNKAINLVSTILNIFYFVAQLVSMIYKKAKQEKQEKI